MAEIDLLRVVCDERITEIRKLSRRIAELEAENGALKKAIREYLGEWDTPAKDYAYRARCRERLRELVEDEG